MATHSRSDNSKVAVQRGRLLKAQAALKELELSVKNGEMVPVSGVVTVWEGRIGACRSRLLGLPGRVAPQVVGCANIGEVKVILERHIYECLDELSIGASVFVDSADVEVSTPAEPVGMGGRKEKVKS